MSTENEQQLEIYDIQKIMSLLPHRYPFLLVDRVTKIIPQKYIEAYKCVTINEPFFQGHFPGAPVMPGVLTIEALAQTSGLLVLAHRPDLLSQDVLFLFSSMDNVRFRRPVTPGDRLDLHCELIKHKLHIWKMSGTAYVDGILVAQAEMTAAIIPKEKLLS